MSKNAVEHSQTLGERLFFDISPQLTPNLSGKKNSLLVIKDRTGFAWSYFLKEKSELKNVMLGLIKDL